jgi:glucose 1-dehydrogenase
MPGNTAYCLFKGGMRMLTRTAAVNWLIASAFLAGEGAPAT